MKKSKAAAATHLAQVGITLFAFLLLLWVNELAFSRIEQSTGIDWIFIPAGIRLLATVTFGLAGFEGLLLAGLYLNFFYFDFHSEFRAWSGAVAGSLGPYVASLLVKHWFVLEPRLEGLTAHRLLFTGALCGLMSPLFHHTFMWILTGHVDWIALGAMVTGDTTGILIVLSLAKVVMSLADPCGRAAQLIRRVTAPMR